MNISTKQEYWYTLIIITISFLILYQYIYDSKIDLNGDNASYYILGKALNAGEGSASDRLSPAHRRLPMVSAE